MFTRTALTSDRFLAAAKAGILAAVRGTMGVGVASASVRNRKGRVSLFVFAERGRSVVIVDTAGRDVTALVLQALRDWHKKARHEAGQGDALRNLTGRLGQVRPGCQ